MIVAAENVWLQRLVGVDLRSDSPVAMHLLFVNHGSCSVSRSEGEQRLWAGAVCITDATLAVRSGDACGWLLSVSEAEINIVADRSGASELVAGIYQMPAADQVRCQTFLEALDYERGRGPLRDPSAERSLLQLILLSCARAGGTVRVAAGRPRISDQLAAQVLGVIERRFEDRLSLAEVAAELSRSPASVSRAARDATGRTMVELIAERRMREARTLLVSGDLPVEEIAGRVGYPNLSHFHRAFRKSTDTTPRRWRAAAGPQPAYAGSVAVGRPAPTSHNRTRFCSDRA